MCASATGAAQWRGRTTARRSLKVATSRASGVGAPVHCSGVVEGADGASVRGGGAPGSDVAQSPAVLTLHIPIGRVGALNSSQSGDESNRGTDRKYVPWVDGDDDGGGRPALPGFCVGIEISGGEDVYVLRVKDRFRHTWEEPFQVFREEGDWAGVDGEL